MTSVAVAGDIYPGPSSSPFLKNGNAEGVFGDLSPVLKDCDLAIANLEAPFIRAPSPIRKIGPVHAIDEGCVRGLAAAGFHVLNLANNHVMDHGARGLENTMRLCHEQGLACVGAGENLSAAGKVLVRETKGARIGILSYTEHEFGIATEGNPGTNPLDVLHFVRTVEAQRDTWDFLIVLLHVGNEYYEYPRPSLRELSRFMSEHGANAVIWQHSHCAGCYETIEGRHLVYGQGNLLFDSRSSRECEQTGFLVVLRLEKPDRCEMELVPYRQSESRPGPGLMNGTEAAQFLQQLAERSRNIQLPGFVEEQWQRFCRDNLNMYLGMHANFHGRIRALNYKFPFVRRLYSDDRLLMLMHLLRCESHREAMAQALQDLQGAC